MAKKCEHDHPISCKDCSLVKMVAYLQNDDKIVWYSPFNTENKYKNNPESIITDMGGRLTRKYGSSLKKIMFFNNQSSEGELIAQK